MRSLRELEADAQMEVPRDIGRAIKAWKVGAANDEQQRMAYRFVVHTIAAINRPSFALPDEPSIMGWRQGRRFVGLQLETIAEAPMTDELPPPEPPPRTMTERVARRDRNL